MSNKDLLKQAIAEAKTIREAAITNAKEALEETLTPHLKEMLAQKLQEMENEDDEVMDENIYEAEEEEVDAEETEEGEEEAGEEEELEIEDMSVEDLKDLIRDIVAQETGNDEEAEMEAGEEGPEGQDDMVSMDSDSEEIDINELLAELEGMDEEGDYGMEEGLKDTFKKVATKVGSTLRKGNEKLEKFIDKGGAAIEKAGLKSPYGGTKAFQESKMEEDDMEEGLKDTFKKVASKVGSTIKKGNDKLEKFIDKGGAAIDKAGLKSPYGGVKAFQEAKQDKEDLQEALKAVKILRGQLQEVNLLNAKLLYVNKVFKSNNLSEGQKVNVIAAFDRAETVKEVKLVFETVSKNVVTKPVAIKEHRSFASKATGNAKTTAPKEILSEVSEQVARWQKLAGIIKS
jgi:hypothetical protein